MDNTFSEKLRSALEPLKIGFTEQQVEAFYRFYEDLVEKNKVMNLTAITEMQDVITKHFADSLSLVPDLESASSVKLQLRRFALSRMQMLSTARRLARQQLLIRKRTARILHGFRLSTLQHLQICVPLVSWVILEPTITR